MPEASAVAAVQFRADLSAAQLAELWKEEEEKAGDLLAHITSLDLEAPQHLLWRDLMLETLLFAKNEAFSATKALAFFGAMNQTTEHLVEKDCSKAELLRHFNSLILAATKAMPPSERYTMPELERLTKHARRALLDQSKLVKLVLTQPQTIRRSTLELFVQRPMPPPALSLAREVSPEELSAAVAAAAEGAKSPSPTGEEETTAASAEAEEASAAEPQTAEVAAAEAVVGQALSNGDVDEKMAAAITNAMASYTEQLKTQMKAEYDAKEAAMLERITKLAENLGVK